MLRQERLNHLGRIAEALEGDPGLVDAGLIQVVHLSRSLHCACKEGIHSRQCDDLLITGRTPQGGTEPAHPFAKPGWSGRVQRPRRLLQQAPLTSFELGYEAGRLRDGLRRLGQLQKHDLDVAEVIQGIENTFDRAPQFAKWRAKSHRPENVQSSKHPPSSDAKVMDRELRGIVAAGFEKPAIVLPEPGKPGLKIGRGLWRHQSLTLISSSTPKASSNTRRRFSSCCRSIERSPRPRRLNCHLAFL